MFNGSTMMIALRPVSMKDVLYPKRKLQNGISLLMIKMPQNTGTKYAEKSEAGNSVRNAKAR